MKSLNPPNSHSSVNGRQSLTFLIIVTTYFLLFFSWVIYFSSLEGQITSLVLKNDLEQKIITSRVFAKIARTRILELVETEGSLKRDIHLQHLIMVTDELATIKKTNDESVVLIDINGDIAYIPDNLPLKYREALTEFQARNSKMEKPIHSHGVFKDVDIVSFEPNNGKLMLATAPVGFGGYRIGTLWDRGNLIESATRLEKVLLGSLLLTFGVIIVLFILLLRLVLSPLKVLIEAAQRIGKGDLSTRVEINAGREMSILAKAFNKMVQDLKLKYGESEEYLKRLRVLNADAQKTLEIVAKRNKELALINALSLECGRHFSFSENLEFLMNKLVNDFELMFAEAYVWDIRRKEWLLGVSSRMLFCPFENNPKFEQLLNKAAETNRVIITSGENYHLKPDSEPVPGEMIITPLEVGSDAKVLVLIATREKGELSSRDIIFFRNLMRHEGVILYNVQLYEASLKRSDILEKINSIGQTIISELNMEKLIPRVLRELKNLLSVDRIVIAFSGQYDEKLVCYSLDEEWELKRFDKYHEDKWVLKTLESDDYYVDQTGGFAPDWTWDLYGEDYRSFLGIRLSDPDRIGLLALYAHDTRFFTNEDIQFMKTFANYLTSAFANAKLFSEINEREQTRTEQLEVAKKLQSDIIPYQYEQGRLEFECSLQPAMELAGDFFDVFSLGPKSVGVVIGDVATKGIAASLMTFSLLSLFRNAAKTLTPPNKVMALVNQGLMTQLKEKSWFATAFYARIHTDDLTMTYAKAGHVHPILFRHTTGETIPLDVEGIPLGIIEDTHFQTGQIKLEEKDRIVMYTDGVTEMKTKEMKLFGINGLMMVVSNNGRKSIADLKDAIFDEINNIANTKYKRDDVLVAVLGIKTDPWISRKLKYDDCQNLITDVMDRLKQLGLPKNVSFAIRLSLNEAITNAHKHGNKGDPEGNIFVSYLITDETFSLKVKDEGQGFDYEALPDPTVEENLLLPHGRGIFLMRSFMDEVDFNDIGNAIQVSKYLTQKIEEHKHESGIKDLVLETLEK